MIRHPNLRRVLCELGFERSDDEIEKAFEVTDGQNCWGCAKEGDDPCLRCFLIALLGEDGYDKLRRGERP